MGKFLAFLMGMVLLCLVFLGSEVLIQKIDKKYGEKDSGVNTARARGDDAVSGATIDRYDKNSTVFIDQTAKATATVPQPAYIDTGQSAPFVSDLYASPVINEETSMAGYIAFLKEPNYIEPTSTLAFGASTGEVWLHLLI
jgi:hypothetical protein